MASPKLTKKPARATAKTKSKKAPVKVATKVKTAKTSGSKSPAVALVPLTSPLARTAKGKRPQYFHDPATDRLQSMLVALMAELSVTRDRLDTLERLIEKSGGPGRKLMEAFNASPEVEAERAASRAAYIARVMRPISHELDAMKAGGKS